MKQNIKSVWKVMIFVTLLWYDNKSVYSETYYVSPDGVNAGPGTNIASPWRTIAYAVQGRGSYLKPGDNVYLRGGLYAGNVNAIDLGATKTCNGLTNYPITISAYNGEIPVICNTTNPYYAVMLSNKSYWKFNGITWSNCYASGYCKNLTNCVWTNCVLGWIPGGIIAVDNEPPAGWANFNLIGESHYNIFINCLFTNWGQIHTNSPGANYHIFGTHLNLGNETYDDKTWYNLVQGCKFVHGGHDVLELYTGFNVFRGNEFINDPYIPTNDFCHLFYNWGKIRTNENTYGAWSARITKPGDVGTNQWDMRNIWESNKFYYSGAPADSPGGHCIELGTVQNVYRFNCLAFGQASGIFLNTSGNGKSSSNAIYNNVICNCGLGYTNSGSSYLQGFHAIEMSNYLIEGKRSNYVVNNILWANYPKNISSLVVANQQYRTNWNGDYNLPEPQFISMSGIGFHYDPNNLPNYQLKSTSPCIDSVTWLAFIKSNDGTGTNFTVDNSIYFSDGNQIVAGDTIQLQGQTNNATVIYNDFTNNVIIFSPALTWTNGQGVALAYRGNAPDMGAFEYDNRVIGSIKPNAPPNLRKLP